MICEKRGVEVTQSKVRRERLLGHIELGNPRLCPYLVPALPPVAGSRLVLDLTLKEIEKLLLRSLYRWWIR